MLVSEVSGVGECARADSAPPPERIAWCGAWWVKRVVRSSSLHRERTSRYSSFFAGHDAGTTPSAAATAAARAPSSHAHLLVRRHLERRVLRPLQSVDRGPTALHGQPPQQAPRAKDLLPVGGRADVVPIALVVVEGRPVAQHQVHVVHSKGAEEDDGERVDHGREQRAPQEELDVRLERSHRECDALRHERQREVAEQQRLVEPRTPLGPRRLSPRHRVEQLLCARKRVGAARCGSAPG
eukprot:7140050-Prymnesium_polylepis.2